MTDRFTLRRIIPNGGGTQDQVIAEPGGWVGHTIKLERHPEFHSLVEYINSNGKFIFTGTDSQDGDGGAEFIRMVEREDGVDAEIQFIAETAEDDVNFQTYFIGMLQLEGLEELPDNEIEVPVIRDDFWSRFLRHWDTKVDLTKNEDIFGNPVDPAVPITVNLLSQKVQQKYQVTQNEPRDAYWESDLTHLYFQIDLWDETLNEIDEKHNISFVFATERVAPLFTVKYAGEYAFDIEYDFTWMFADPDTFDRGLFNTEFRIEMFIQVNDEAPIQFAETHFGNNSGSPTANDRWSKYTFSSTLTLNAGDNVRVFGTNNTAFPYPNSKLAILGNESGVLDWQGIEPAGGTDVDFDFSGQTNTHFSIIADTTYPETEVEGFFAHDMAAAILARIGLGDGSFYSAYLGNTKTNARVYEEDGGASRFFITKGLFIRGYTLSKNPDDPAQRYSLQEKGFQVSFKDWWDGMDPIFCLGLGYETLEESPEQQVIRVEHRGYFYGGLLWNQE